MTLPYSGTDNSPKSLWITNTSDATSSAAIEADGYANPQGYGIVANGGRAGIIASISSGQAAVMGQALVQTGGFGTGVLGVTQSANSYDAGVVGANTGNGSNSPGVMGKSYSGASGVYGTSTNGPGVYAMSIGTGFNAAALTATNTTNGGMALYAYAITDTGVNGAPAAAAVITNDTTSTSADILEGWNLAAKKFSVSTAGEVYAHGAFHPNGVDYSDRLPSASGLEPGDVVALGHDGLLHETIRANETDVAGVYSTRPGVVGQREEETRTTIPVALAGMIPVKASDENGAIQIGDLLVSSSTPGRAMRAPANPRPGTVIGKAMQPLESGNGEIEMLVMLR